MTLNVMFVALKNTDVPLSPVGVVEFVVVTFVSELFMVIFIVEFVLFVMSDPWTVALTFSVIVM